MRKALVVLAAIGLAGCSEDGKPIFDGQSFLSTLEGPSIPTVKDTLIQSAEMAEKQGNFSQAAQYYQQALEKSPNDKEIALSLGDAYRRGGQFDRAIAVFDVILGVDAVNSSAKEGKGLALMGKGDFNTPPKLFAEVMQAEPNRWKTLNALGILFTTRSMHYEAQQYFQEALKGNPNNATVLNNYGLSKALDKSNEEAIAQLQRASDLSDVGSYERKRVDMNLALVYAIAGQISSASSIAETYFSGPELANNLGLYAHLAKDDALAKAYLNMALTESKSYYGKAWDNLETVSAGSKTAAPAAEEKQTKIPAPEKPKKPEAVEKKAEKKPAKKEEVKAKKKPEQKKAN